MTEAVKIFTMTCTYMSYLFMERCSNLEFEAIKDVIFHFLSASGLMGFNPKRPKLFGQLDNWGVGGEETYSNPSPFSLQTN